MTSAAATTRALQPFSYNQLVTNSAQLIAEYADENGQKPRAIPLIQCVTSWLCGASKKQVDVEGEFVQKWKPELEAEKALTPWLEKQVFRIKDSADQPFMNAVHVILVEIAKIDRQWLEGLAEKLLAKHEYVTIERERYVDPFTKAILGDTLGHLGSQANRVSMSMECWGRKHTNTLHTVKLCLEEDEMFLHRDNSNDPIEGSALYLRKLSSCRTLHHELLHIEQELTGKAAEYLADVPKSYRWTNGMEMMTIRGSGNNAKGEPLEKAVHSENSFALAAGEMERIAHSGIPNISALPKKQQLIIALRLGAYGTVSELMSEAIHHACYIDMINREPHKKAAIEKMLAERNVFDITTISCEEVTRINETTMDLPLTDNEEDGNFRELISKGKRKACTSVENCRSVCLEIREKHKNSPSCEKRLTTASVRWKPWYTVAALILPVAVFLMQSVLAQLQAEK